MVKELEQILEKWCADKEKGIYGIQPKYIFSIEKEIEENGKKRLVDDWCLEYELEEFFSKYPEIQWKWEEIGEAVGCHEKFCCLAFIYKNKLYTYPIYYYI